MTASTAAISGAVARLNGRGEYEGAWVDVVIDLSWRPPAESGDGWQPAVSHLTRLVRGWNLQDEAGTPVPANPAGFQRVGLRFLADLVWSYAEVMERLRPTWMGRN